MSISRGSLAGTIVVDASRVLAGPYAAQILGDHGADVVKVESFDGDDTRGFGPPFVDGTAPYYLGLNRNKQDLALDLSTPRGIDVLFGNARDGGRVHRELQDVDVAQMGHR
jgi:crotonobetainyl-CoA:carnitine CoA-transferase CaiB-like acyl-CoA transferase